MAITVPFDRAYAFEVSAPAAEVFAVLADVPSSARHFPKVSKLVDLANGAQRWEMEKVDSAKLNFQTVYASHYVTDKKKGTVVWTPLAGEGNASIGGSWAVTDKKTHTHIALKIAGELTLPLSSLMKTLVAAFAISENDKLVEQYIASLCQAFGGAHGG